MTAQLLATILVSQSAAVVPEALNITPGPPLTLAEALKMADNRNLSVQAARAQVEQAQADLQAAWGLLHPRASASATWTHNDHADVFRSGGQSLVTRRQDTLQGTMQVNATLLDARAWFGIGVADAGAELAHWSSEQIRQALLLSVAQAYFSALAAKSLIDVQLEQIQATERHREVTSLRHRTGTGSRLDVIRANTDLALAHEDLVRAHTTLANARDLLARLIQHDELPMPVPDVSAPLPEEDPETLIERALREREDLKARRSQVRLADKSLSVSWMSFLPSLNATWQLNQQFNEPGDIGSPDKLRWFVGLTLSVPIYDYTMFTGVSKSRAALRQALAEAQDAEQQASLEVRNAHRGWLEAEALVETAERQARLGREALELVEVAYVSGTGSSLEVTDARRASRQAEINMATRRLDAELALLGLLRATGVDMTGLGSD